MSVTICVTDDIDICLDLRRIVFMSEQSVPEDEERDGHDDEAVHLLARHAGRPVGCARVLPLGSTAKIGRVCVLADRRGTGLGRALMRAAVDVARGLDGVTEARLGAQTHALGFYERLGFVAEGPEFLDAGIPHRTMVLPL